MAQSETFKAFGKFNPSQASALRGFEIQLGIRERGAWSSDAPCVQRLLDHLRRYTQSDASREKYLRHFLQFSRWCNHAPEDLVRLQKRGIEQAIQGFVDDLATKDRSKAYVNSVIKRLRTFFRANGYVGSRELKIHGYFMPARYRKVPEYIPTKGEVHTMADAAGSLRDRAIILTLWTSGLRVSTLCALNYGDVAEELGSGEPYVMIQVNVEMKRRVPDAVKNLISYHTFICPEAGEALRSYHRDREGKYGKIGHENPLFYSDWTLWTRGERSGKRLGRRGVGLIVKRSARLAGIQQLKHVTPHCLRKAFESVLRSQMVDGGRMDKGTQEFFMGHILPGTQDTYYDKTKIDFYRGEYAKLDFAIGRGYTKSADKVIDVSDLEKYLGEGCLFVAKINDSKIIVRRSD